MNLQRLRLRVFKLDRATALYTLLAFFEITVMDLYLYDRVYRAHEPDATITPMSGRNKVEDALCSLVDYGWRNCRAPATYPSCNGETIRMAIEAYHYQIMRDLIDDSLEASRSNLVSIRADEESIRFKELENSKSQVDAMRRELAWEPDNESRELASTTPGIGGSLHPVQRWHELLIRRAQDQGFTPQMRLGDYTTDEYAGFWSALLHINAIRQHAYRRLMVRGPNLIDPYMLVQVISKDDLVVDIASISNLEDSKCARILDSLVYCEAESTDQLFLRPIVPLAGELHAMAPCLIINNHVFRNLRQRLALETSDDYSIISGGLASEVVDRLSSMLSANGYKTLKGVPIPGTGKPDIDLIALKGGVILVLQVKNLNPPDSWKQIRHAEEQVADGLRQLNESVEYVKSNPDIIATLFHERIVPAPRIEDFLITGLRPLLGLSLDAVQKMDRIAALSEFETRLKTLEGLPLTRESRHVQPLGLLLMKARVGRITVEIESRNPHAKKNEVTRLERLLPLEDCLTYLKL